MIAVVFLTLVSTTARLATAGEASRYFAIRVVDEATGRGVPLVELRTVNELQFHTDSAGYVAFLEPGLMDQQVYFHVRSHGYEFPADGFGFRGRALQVTPGGHAELKIRRTQRAERLYRLTGAGTYADSQLLGKSPEWSPPSLDAQVMGSDSVVCAIHRDRVHWFWGDTNRPDYPLGNFHVPGASSSLPAAGKWSPRDRIPWEYFVDARGRAKETAHLPGTGPTWINGLASVPDAEAREWLLASYDKIRPPLEVAERGIAAFDEDRQEFKAVRTVPVEAPLRPFGHPFRHRDAGVEYVYFGDPFPWVRVRATREAYLDLDQYEGYTAIRTDSRPASPEVERDGDGRPRFAWRRGAAPWTADLEAQLLAAGQLRPDEARLKLVDPDSRKPVVAHRGSVNWNAFRERWIAIFVEMGGSTSLLGEIWFAEAPSPEGPWSGAVKIVTHDKYSFYNPKQHAFLDEEGGRWIYFEGTYTRSFSGNPQPTPRYDYNQILYRVDLRSL